jgi:hypothetical protein
MVEVNAMLISDVNSIDSETEDLDISFDEVSDSGDIAQFECEECRYILRTKKSNRIVQTEADLIQWMKDYWDHGCCALEPNQPYMMATIRVAIPLNRCCEYTGSNSKIPMDSSRYATCVSDIISETLREQMFEDDPWFHDYAFEVDQTIKETNDFPREGMFFD